MAQVLTDKDGNPLWIPAGTPGRDKWAEVIYGISEADALKQYYENFGQWFPYYVGSPLKERHTALWPFIWKNLKVNFIGPSFRPVWIPFWLYYGFVHEQELDEYLSQYADKLRNFDWENPLKMAYLFIDAIVSEYSREIRNLGWPEVEEKISYLKQDAETAKQLLAAEYLYYLGPIKFALKANLTFYLTGIHIAYTGTWVPSSFAGTVILPLQHVAWRDVLIFQTTDGRQLKYIVSWCSRSELLRKSPDELRRIALLGHETYFQPGYFAELLQMLQLPTIAWVEARDETVIPDHSGFVNLFELAKEIPPIPMDQTTKVYVPEFSLQYALQPTTQTEAPTIAPPPPPTTTTPLTTTTSPTTTTAQPQPTSEVSAPTTSLLPSPTIAPTSAEQSKLMGGLGTLGGLALAGIILLLLLRRE
jgi:hypothetical protein